MNYSKQSLQFQIGQIGDSEKRILKYGKQLTSFELQRSSCFLKKSPSKVLSRIMRKFICRPWLNDVSRQ